MSLAYMLVTGTYMVIGGAFYICFPLPKFCIEDVSSKSTLKLDIEIFCIDLESLEQLPQDRHVDGGREGLPLLPDDDRLPPYHVHPQGCCHISPF